MWIARTEAQWRQLADEYGKWNSIFRRYRRWVETGVFEAMLEFLFELVKRDQSVDMVDSTASSTSSRTGGAMRQTKDSCLGFVAIAAIKLWMPFVHER